MAGFEPSKAATFKVFVNPLVFWMWMGGLVVVLGTIIAIWPERRPYGAGQQHTAGQVAITAAQGTNS
jgi:cytochrome c-type biogenesis protein CcmF